MLYTFTIDVLGFLPYPYQSKSCKLFIYWFMLIWSICRYTKLRTYASQKSGPVDYTDEPIKFSQSAAKSYKASESRSGVSEPRLWYEQYVILGSLTIFLIYFCVLREENDIDKELGRSLYSRIEGLEEVQLKMSLQYNLDNGLDTTAIVQRLQEIEEEKKRRNEEDWVLSVLYERFI